ncbi:DUF1801 domain-containing protein [Chryseolinea lacunae]|uniref:DUF1801 domain-containing protein n=1 Tax=Chryseolinea lacunae TaxID=2801331 RepID=A0ABS1L2C0_9BACT|nr:DUF1801 domain-containing protein [Chryseolinea lacunae]MBL0744696.1 DUF1801 domain-containing protein [Chryseolinea lacunae]
MPAPAKTVDIDQMIATLPRHEQVLVKRLRALVAECIPNATEKAYDNQVMPFYTRNRLICFIWPPSMVWERNANLEKQKAKGVALGFSQGNLMANDDGVLLAEGRKQVYMMYFKKLADIDDNQIRALLFEAAMIDEQFAKKKKSR